jgi:hypothetical protein
MGSPEEDNLLIEDLTPKAATSPLSGQSGGRCTGGSQPVGKHRWTRRLRDQGNLLSNRRGGTPATFDNME